MVDNDARDGRTEVSMTTVIAILKLKRNLPNVHCV